MAITADVRKNLLEYHNDRRRQLGLVTLRLDGTLNDGAQRYADIMAANNWFSHTRPSGLSWTEWWDRYYPEDYDYPKRSIGENLARGQNHSDEVFADWMASADHRANIQKGAFRRVGFGMTRADSDGREYWVAHYCSKPY